jgi:hypothetical protein
LPLSLTVMSGRASRKRISDAGSVDEKMPVTLSSAMLESRMTR